jgi:CheY-like chemotaxis protein
MLLTASGMNAVATIPKGLRVLLVDDEPSVRQGISWYLTELFGCEVTEAGDAVEGLEAYEPGKFDIVFTDYLMPGMNGGKFAAVLREKSASQPIIMVTAYPQAGSDPCLNAVLRKPCTASEVAEVINGVLATTGNRG